MVTFDTYGKILSVNKAIKSMFGYSYEEVVDYQIGSLFLIDTVEKEAKSKQIDMSFIKQAGERVFEVIALRKDKSWFHADIQVGKTTVEGHEIFVCTIRDITERKQMEEDKKQKYIDMETIVQE
ncbi:PAS domain S-box protein, partial [Desertibacillus haloalkaliphilus]|uniref:PAS domain S-box protein n=1 Tax=Desertibacillus haloalkaliphilus TaxID=1328930 RepID=UPI0028A9146C